MKTTAFAAALLALTSAREDNEIYNAHDYMTKVKEVENGKLFTV